MPEPQSPVRQVNLESWVQWVRAHRRPDQEAGTEIEVDWPASKEKPVGDSCGVPAFESMPGHIVLLHLFVIVNVDDNVPNQLN